MIHFVSGNPGGGKSYYALRQILFELQHSKRRVVTNLSLNLPAVQEYLSKSAWWDGNHVSDRVQTLSEEQTREFFRYRGGAVLPMVLSSGLGFEVPDFSQIEPVGVLYVLDEVHVYFGAREWFKTGQVVIWYQSQHRKLGDDLVLVSQHPEQVDKAFRRLAQDWSYLRNLAQEKTFGFTARGWLRRTCYLKPKSFGDGQLPQETGFVKLDVSGLCGLYDTNSGVGISGRVDAKKESRVRGFPWWSAPIFVLLILAGLWFGLQGLMRGFQWGLARTAMKGAEVAKAAMHPSTNVSLSVMPAVPVVRSAEPGLGSNSSWSGEVPCYLQRVSMIGRDATWYLSDGRVVRPLDSDFVAGGEDWLKLRSGLFRRGIRERSVVVEEKVGNSVVEIPSRVPSRWLPTVTAVPVVPVRGSLSNRSALEVLRSIP